MYSFSLSNSISSIFFTNSEVSASEILQMFPRYQMDSAVIIQINFQPHIGVLPVSKLGEKCFRSNILSCWHLKWCKSCCVWRKDRITKHNSQVKEVQHDTLRNRWSLVQSWNLARERRHIFNPSEISCGLSFKT